MILPLTTPIIPSITIHNLLIILPRQEKRHRLDIIQIDLVHRNTVRPVPVLRLHADLCIIVLPPTVWVYLLYGLLILFLLELLDVNSVLGLVDDDEFGL